MINKSTIIALTSLALICTSAYAQDWKDSWRTSPLTSKNSNEWRKKPYTGHTSDSWRNSPFSARQSESKLRWDKSRWQKSSMNWRNSPYVKRPLDSGSWQNGWNKKKWRDNPLNWRNSDLEWKNSRAKLEREYTKQEIKVWASPKVQEFPSDTEETRKMPKVEKDLKPQIEIISEGDDVSNDPITEAGKYSIGKNNSITVYNAEGIKVIKPGKPITKKLDDGAIVIY